MKRSARSRTTRISQLSTERYLWSEYAAARSLWHRRRLWHQCNRHTYKHVSAYIRSDHCKDHTHMMMCRKRKKTAAPMPALLSVPWYKASIIPSSMRAMPHPANPMARRMSQHFYSRHQCNQDVLRSQTRPIRSMSKTLQ